MSQSQLFFYTCFYFEDQSAVIYLTPFSHEVSTHTALCSFPGHGRITADDSDCFEYLMKSRNRPVLGLTVLVVAVRKRAAVIIIGSPTRMNRPCPGPGT